MERPGRWSSSATKRSRVGQKLSDLTTLRVVIGILALLLIVPAFNITSALYGNAPTINYGGLVMLHDVFVVVRPCKSQQQRQPILTCFRGCFA